MLFDFTAAELEELVFKLREANILGNIADEQTHFVLAIYFIK